MEKERTKKSAATFCVEFRAGKQEQVPCTQGQPQGFVQQEPSRPVVIVPVPAPVPIVERQPLVIQQYPQPQPQPLPLPQPQPLPLPQPQPQSLPDPPMPIATPAIAPAPAPVPIINIVPSAPAPAPCDKPIVVQHPQSQIHTVHVIHPQLSSVPKEKPEEKPMRPMVMPPVQQKMIVMKPTMPQMPVPCKHSSLNPMMFASPMTPMGLMVQPLPAYVPNQWDQGICKTCEKEALHCSCQPENSMIMRSSPRFARIEDPRMEYPTAAVDSASFRSSRILPMENDRFIPDQSKFYTSEGARETQERHHKKYAPLNFNVNFPVVSDNTPKYYQPQYYPSYTNPLTPTQNSYIYPSSYGAYETSYPVSYGNQGSNVPAVTVNAGGPFYARESQHIDPSSQSNNEALPREAMFSTDAEGTSNLNIQLKNEPKEITQDHQGSQFPS